jgi:hypothetical protein
VSNLLVTEQTEILGADVLEETVLSEYDHVCLVDIEDLTPNRKQDYIMLSVIHDYAVVGINPQTDSHAVF